MIKHVKDFFKGKKTAFERKVRQRVKIKGLKFIKIISYARHYVSYQVILRVGKKTLGRKDLRGLQQDNEIRVANLHIQVILKVLEKFCKT